MNKKPMDPRLRFKNAFNTFSKKIKIKTKKKVIESFDFILYLGISILFNNILDSQCSKKCIDFSIEVFFFLKTIFRVVKML